MTRLFPRKMKQAQASKLESVTLHGFGGGWNAVHDDLSMESRFLVNAENVRRTASGASKVRFGSTWFADGSSVATGIEIIDEEYFESRVVCVTDTGQIFTVSEDGDTVLIWSEAIANALPGTPSGWGSTFTTVDFVPFGNRLAIHNGVDKPIIIDTDFSVDYLQDEATGSNVNVPIGKYGCTVSNYHCVAGIDGSPTIIYITSKGTSGTFPGDVPPNDSISFDVGAYVSGDTTAIRGIAGFRTNLIVFFRGQSLVITLGEYDTDGNHTPKFPDTLPKFGLLGHRCIMPLENDMQFADLSGLCSAKRNLFSSALDSKHLSEYIQPPYMRAISELDDESRQENCFAIFDPLSHSSLVFTGEGNVFVYSANDDLHYRGWSKYTGMNWRCGCSSVLGRVFVASGMRVFQLGNDVYLDEDYSADRMLDRDGEWTNNTPYLVNTIVYEPISAKSYICNISHRSALTPLTFADEIVTNVDYWTEYKGEEIDFVMELPWFNGRDPMRIKHLRFASLATKGTAKFTLEIYVDNIFNTEYETLAYLEDTDGVLLADIDDALLLDTVYATVSPALSMDFIGNDARGFGQESVPFGGGRRSNDPRLFGVPCKFKSLKMRFVGSVREPLTIATASFLYSRGKYKR